jgi:hypothetical protein
MNIAQLSAAYTPRLLALRANVPRKRIVCTLPFPPDIEVHSWEWALLRGEFRKHFGAKL